MGERESLPSPAPHVGEETGGRGVALRLSFADANPSPTVEPFNRLETKVSYVLGNDPAKRRPDVPVWGGVRYREIYPGIDLEVLGDRGQWSWRMVATQTGAVGVLSAQTALASVGLQVEGADAVAVQENALHLTTAAGEVRLPLLTAVVASGSPTSVLVTPLPSVGEGPGVRAATPGVRATTITAPFSTGFSRPPIPGPRPRRAPPTSSSAPSSAVRASTRDMPLPSTGAGRSTSRGGALRVAFPRRLGPTTPASMAATTPSWRS